MTNCICGGKMDLADTRILGINSLDTFVLYCDSCKKVTSLDQALNEQKEQILNFFQWG
jgi:hypothetical protein